MNVVEFEIWEYTMDNAICLMEKRTNEMKFRMISELFFSNDLWFCRIKQFTSRWRIIIENENEFP
jgi:hypothetical protein